ncbi:hypothetical protein NQ315_008927 [Exocentrus adspersus]|uniref:UBZ1-type domain-containing protein n=1 Tax=Exocentrus adspersus TaxID=1586481 RepID=A0AAV8V761_9CUCU|nr:hypothetical protein NQ315_008927 [Exocentrus adspersus]
MEESLGAQYAIQIAVQTLRDRCKNLQQRVATLEEENTNLRIQCSRNDNINNSLTETDKFREYIMELEEQKQQLQTRIRMICTENQDLWSKLGKLTTVNKNLGEQLNKISDTVTRVSSPIQPHTPLIRSRTFTQDEPQTRFLQKNLEINEKISLELEDISLKLTDSFCQQKMELDRLCSEMDGMQFNDNIITKKFGFFYEEELDEDLVDEVKCLLENLKMLRDETLRQKSIMKKNLMNLSDLQEKLVCKACERKTNNICDKSTSTNDIPKSVADKCTEVANFDSDILRPPTELPSPDRDRVCPVCSKYFRKDIQFTEFHQHVEDHFSSNIESYEII